MEEPYITIAQMADNKPVPFTASCLILLHTGFL